jgi:hypothetical protein
MPEQGEHTAIAEDGAALGVRAAALHRAAGRSHMMGTAFVLGNGPSLKGVDLGRFAAVATIGMNAAYREWERVGWYPRHYCCLDEELIVTHHDAISSLIEEERVSSAFLTAGILEFHPELADNDRCFFLDSFRKAGRWRERRNKFGLPYSEEEAFVTSAPSKVTTGGYAVRYAIFLGYRKLYLLGIDCNYVELIPSARQIGEIALEMVDTPDENPNYFFDDYQQQGDRYNIPNPGAHGGNLHVQALEAVRDDVIERGLPVEIRNCARKSKLVSEGVFPFEDLDVALGKPQLGAVAVPMTFGEERSLITSFQRWSRPAAAPRYPTGSGYPVPLVAVLNSTRDAEFEDRVTTAFEESGLRPHSFSRIEFLYCELTADEDKYQRDYSKRAGAGGHKSGPNAQFFKSMELLARHGRYVFMMETDCIPVRPDWLSELERVVEGAEPFWILGSLYRGVDDINSKYRVHINGNAVYAVGDPEFQEFVAGVWKPAVARLVEKIKTLAYDCALPLHFNEENLAPTGRKWQQYQQLAHRIRYTDFIQNHASVAELQRGEGYELEAIRNASPRTYIVHGRHLLKQTTKVRFDAVAIHQMGKVGSRSLVAAVDDLEIWPTFHTHVLNVTENEALDPDNEPKSFERHAEVPDHIWAARELRSRFLEEGRPIAIITAVREPIARNVSAFFQNLEGFVAEGKISGEDPDELYELFQRTYPHRQPQKWFENELNDPLGVDVFATPFPDEGFAMIDAEPHQILIIKTSIDDEQKSAALSTFLGVPGLTVPRVNITTRKAKRSGRASLLERFKQRVGQDTAYLDRMLDLRVAKHFLTEQERTEVRERWQRTGEVPFAQLELPGEF